MACQFRVCVPGMCLAQLMFNTSSLSARSHRVVRALMSLSGSAGSGMAHTRSGSACNRSVTTWFSPWMLQDARERARGDYELMYWDADVSGWGEMWFLRGFLWGGGTLRYTLESELILLLYFCRPPRTRSKRTPGVTHTHTHK